MARVSESQKVVQKFNNCGGGVQFWFEHVPEIIAKLDNSGIALAYCFQQIESGHRRALYAGLLRKYRLDPAKTWEQIDAHYMHISDFQKFYAAASLSPLMQDTFALLFNATKVRNKVTHGQEVGQVEKWKAVLDCLQYADDFNNQNQKNSGFDVFGRLQGVTSSNATTMTPEVTELVLKGLGFETLPMKPKLSPARRP